MIIDTLILLNNTTFCSLNETDEKKIISTFTELAVKVLEANFGFVWMRKIDQKFELSYQSRRLPYIPLSPKKDGLNAKVLKSLKPTYITDVKESKDTYTVSRYMKSFVIIPIAYQKNVYGNIIICFKKPETFSKEKQVLCTLIGSNIAHVMTIFRNRKLLKEGEEYRRKIEEEELRTEFLADAMHEIRTPIAVIKGTVDLALKSSQIISKTVAFKSINIELAHLTEILSELSILTSKDSDIQRKIKTKRINLATFIRKISKRWKALAGKRGVVIRVKKIPSVSILADESYLNKLFTNIVKNAITYGKNNGHIDISGIIQDDMVKINIQDDGRGISRHDLKRVFERFYRVDESRSSLNNYSGTGLGLAIAKWIAEAHGGKISVVSTPDKGSIFSVTLPFV